MKEAFLKTALLNDTTLLEETTVSDPLNLEVPLERSMAIVKDKCIATLKTRVINCLGIILVTRTANCTGDISSVLYLNEVTYLSKQFQEVRAKVSRQKTL